MPQKVTLTGIPTTPLRIMKSMMAKDNNAPKVYSFEMQESGSPAAAKYLPKGSEITFTVFMNEKQLRKAGLDEVSFLGKKIMIQGEIVLDLDMNICPGEIGVSANQIQLILPKESSPVDLTENEGIQKAADLL